MTRLGKLKREALESCKSRGHVMGEWDLDEYNCAKVAYNECTICGKYVQVNTRPLPNEIDIGGDAVAMNCERQ